MSLCLSCCICNMGIKTHSFNKYLLSMFYMPNTVLGLGDTAMNKTEIPGFMEFTF